MNINIAITNNITIIRKVVHIFIIPVFTMLLVVKSFEIFPKHNIYGFISPFFALN